jgi:hypothetical protein
LLSEQLEHRIEQGGREADLAALLVAETDLMVDSANTVSAVLGRAR